MSHTCQRCGREFDTADKLNAHMLETGNAIDRLLWQDTMLPHRMMLWLVTSFLGSLLLGNIGPWHW